MSKLHSTKEIAELPWLDQWHLYFTHLVLQCADPANPPSYPHLGQQIRWLSTFFHFWGWGMWGRGIPPDEVVPAPAVVHLVFVLVQLIPAWHMFPESLQAEMEAPFQKLISLVEDRLLKLARIELKMARQFRGELVPSDDRPPLPVDVSALPDADLDRLAKAIELQLAIREFRRPVEIPQVA